MTKEQFHKVMRRNIAHWVEREEERYKCGMSNHYFEIKDEAEELLEAVEDVKWLKVENAELRREVKRLNDKVCGRG